ncbi:hypothetical protein Q8F55_007198 [Vanrija albida]|uniref:Eisosome component PIL1-domain-containing protein n=1 Tax=Vanrija albida TaxID=181172 RepID=A0ABR3PZ78_9TREE
MTLRGASGKFSLPTFGRKSNANDNSPTQGSRIPSNSTPQYAPNPDTTSKLSHGRDSDSIIAPHHDFSGVHLGGGGGGANGSNGSSLDGFGKKIGKSIAHTSFLPSLGNQDLRALQDVISSEKNVLTGAERFAGEVQAAAGKLPVYGEQEGADLKDILGHSSTLLNQLSAALRVFAGHENNMRQCFKRIREREEALDELRRRRRTTATKAESAERKLAKMGPENKQLISQTELLENLRGQMRQMDSDIVNEESKLGDYKRQSTKEALSYKFGGLEELGEKMCIIGELGKLLIEEIPLEETPPGYGRAPYTAYEKTHSTATEAIKCLGTVQFHAGSAAPKPPGLPVPALDAQTPPPFQNHSVADHEEYGDYPAKAAASPEKPPQLPQLDGLSLDGHSNDRYSEFGASAPSATSTVVWNGPTADDLYAHDYEYQQQREIDEAAQRDGAALGVAGAAAAGLGAAAAIGHQRSESGSATVREEGSSWQPLKVRRDHAATPDLASSPPPAQQGYQLRDGPGYTLPSVYALPDAPSAPTHQTQPSVSDSLAAPSDIERPGSTNSGYYTPPPGPDSRSASIDVGHPGRTTPKPYAPTPLNTDVAGGSTEEVTPVVAIPPSSAPPPYIPPASPPSGLAYDDESPQVPQIARLPTPPSRDEPAVVSIGAEPGHFIPPIQVSGGSRESYYLPRFPSDRDGLANTAGYNKHDSIGQHSIAHDSIAARSSIANSFADISIPDMTVSNVETVPGPTSPRDFRFSPPPSTTGGVMSAAAFRRGVRQTSEDPDAPAPTHQVRRLPQLPTGVPPPRQSTPSVPSSPRESADYYADRQYGYETEGNGNGQVHSQHGNRL